jgi:hypothetical protein
LLDARTIIGTTFDNPSTLIIEQTNSKKGKKVFYISQHKASITMIHCNDQSQDVFTAVSGGKVNQFKRDWSSQSWRRVKEFPNLGLEKIICSVSFKNLVVFGDSRSKFAVVNALYRQVVLKGFECAVNRISSLQICEVSSLRFILSICGAQRKYSRAKSDLYDVTGIVTKFGSVLRSDTRKDRKIEGA